MFHVIIFICLHDDSIICVRTDDSEYVIRVCGHACG